MSRGHPTRAERAEDQCEAVTVETPWKKRQQSELRCPYVAKVMVEHKRLCNRHASMEALAICLSTEKAQLITTIKTVRLPYQRVEVIKR